jgi:hypothetical protein
MSPVRRIWRRMTPNILAIVAAVAIVVAIGCAVLLSISSSQQSDKLAKLAHSTLQQSINARYDDCRAGDQVREALHEQARASSRSDALLYRLLPSLDTPEVHKLVRRTRADQLRAFRPRGDDGCTIYALRAVPRNATGEYTLPDEP